MLGFHIKIKTNASLCIAYLSQQIFNKIDQYLRITPNSH